MSILVESRMGQLNEDRKEVYPLFQKGARPKDINPVSDSLPPPSTEPDIQKPENKKTTKRTSNRSKAPVESYYATPDSLAASLAHDHAELMEVDPNNGRRKRRKTASLDMKDTHKDKESSEPLEYVQQQPLSVTTIPDRPTSNVPDVKEALIDTGRPTASELADTHNLAAKEVSGNTGIGNSSVPECAEDVEEKPKKILKFNPKTGTIGSPPRKAVPVTEPKLKKAVGRPKKITSKLVIIQYDPSIGPRIEQILKSPKRTLPSPVKPAQVVIAPASKKPVISQPPKSLHPLFLGKLATKSSPRKVVDLTLVPSPPKLKARNSKSPPAKPKLLFSGFGNTSKLVKFPGSVEPAWPWKGTVHVRGNDSDYLLRDRAFPILADEKMKKSKGNATEIPDTEYIIDDLAKDLHISELAKSLQELDMDEYPVVPPGLRAAIKRHESGASIRKRVRKELYTKPPTQMSSNSSSEDDIQSNRTRNRSIHPALSTLYDSIPSSYSAFDKGQCEIQGWASKYAPKRAVEVLQTGEEAVILKGWLNALTVNTVGSSNTSSILMKAKKKKRKARKLDEFIVSSDETEVIVDEASENDADLCSRSGKKTFFKRGVSKETGRPNNAILMSGPHGSGKTAAVFAVAKELGFEIFEINPGSRRSGKDITDKVGDMTRNHLVQHSTIQPSVELNADEQRLDDALADELRSGRQGTMNSFFKSKPDSRPKATKVPKENLEIKKGLNTSRQRPREQKQSLILIEEVDVLYKEDTQFWPTIINLIQSSKRPIIMTCNDESLVDTILLSLHGILRFSPPPLNLAVDYMLMVAACEGHVLKRAAIQSLYESRGLDLRAALTDLNFWCQFGVGSVRGGLDWFYSRFPRGGDVDDNGDTVRVVSEGTYQAGMGCFNQDYLQSHIHHLDIEEEMLHEVWNGWELDAGNWQANLDISTWANRQPRDSFATLSMYEEFAETMSDADICSRRMISGLDDKLDTSTLPPTQKALDGFVLPYTVLAASPEVDYSTSRQESLWLRSRARAYLHIDQHVKHDMDVPTELDRLSEARMLQLIRKKASYPDQHIQREDFDYAFEPISTADKQYAWSTSPSLVSVLSGTLSPIVQDIAPYVRSIVAYDACLAQERIRMSNLLSEGGKSGKRMRKTRAAMSALEGGVRRETRREKYFGEQLNPFLVAKTGLQSWMDASVAQTEAERRAVMALERRERNGSVESALTGTTTDGEVGA